jgi:ADP-ribosylglycohydrolase
MRVAPLAVWSAGYFDYPEQVHKAIRNDVEFTHTNVLVHESAFVYASAIQYLLLNPNESDRALNAFNYAVKLSEENVSNHKAALDSCKIWLDKSLKMANEAKEAKLEKYSSTGDLKLKQKHVSLISNNVDCTNKKTKNWVKHSFILSFYMLLQYHNGILSSESAFQDVLRLVI